MTYSRGSVTKPVSALAATVGGQVIAGTADRLLVEPGRVLVAGTATVAGYDVATQSVDVRRSIGYCSQVGSTFSGAYAGVSGGLLASLMFYVGPQMLHWSTSGDVVIMVLLGGMGDDLLLGQSGRDLMIGGLGADRLVGISLPRGDKLLISILAYYTRDNEQVRRMFRYTVPGKREKHQGNNRWIDRCIKRFRAQQPTSANIDEAMTAADNLRREFDEAQSPAPAEPTPPAVEMHRPVQAPPPARPAPTPTNDVGNVVDQVDVPLVVDPLPLTEIAKHRKQASELVDKVGFNN